jgi:hypothetical protein
MVMHLLLGRAMAEGNGGVKMKHRTGELPIIAIRKRRGYDKHYGFAS